MGVGKDKDEIVISGISGRFPESNNIKEFMENLLANKNMVTCNDRRFKAGLFDTPKGFGTLKEIDKFDATPFGILPKQGENMDPQSRIALETTYEALFDAGANPNSLRGSKTGVFSAVMFHDALDIHSAQPSRITGTNSVNMFGALIPNRISYIFDWNGPSANYDTACSSSIFALEAAVRAIENGKCNDAIVVGSTIILSPIHTLMFKQGGMLASDYTTRAFDCSGLGYVRAEAVVSIYIQKKSLAFRSYLTILGIGNNNDGFKEEGNSYPSAMMQEELLEQVYTEANVNPEDVTYVEAHGTGTPAGDPTEVKSISKFFCAKNRKSPLLIGTVKSNMGHAESASGLCSIAKVIVIIQSGLIPANLHFNKPHSQSNFIRKNIIKVVTENTKWGGGLIGLNSFGFGGVNTHVILKPNIQRQDSPLLSHDVVLFSGKTDYGVENCLEVVLTLANINQYYLLNEVHKQSVKTETFRGFGIKLEENLIEVGNGDKTPESLWYVFNGMGSQWVGMGQSLLHTVPTFKLAFDQCSEALKPFNYDLEKVFNSSDPDIFTNNPTNTFVCIGIIQIGLLDVLKEIGLKPDGLIGHSCGEHLCAYADDCLTKEQTIISIYLRGKACEEFSSNGISYGMAAVNMAFEKVKEICPKGLYPVCDNGPESTTIAGPTQLIQEFKIQLENISADINVKPVQSSGMPFHSPYLERCADMYKEYLESKMNIESVVRSQKWISTSIPEDQWDLVENKLFTHEHLCKNFSSPVLFLTALKRIPDNSTVIEIGPSGLLRGLIQRGTKDCSVISLQTRNETNCLLSLQRALGRLFVSGVNFDINKIASYRNDIELPVPGNTPMIGHLVDWDHSISWAVPNYQKANGTGGVGLVRVDMSSPDEAFLVGHTIQGRVLYPTTGYIQMVRNLFAQMNSTHVNELPVLFENLKIQRITLLRQKEIIEFRITISEISGYFEIKESDAVVCSGTIRIARANDAQITDEDFEARETFSALLKFQLKHDDIYKKFRHLGYEYQGFFKGILDCNLAGTDFMIEWSENWIGFLDTLIQTNIRTYSEEELNGWKIRDMGLPTAFTRFLIDPTKFYKNNTSLVYAQYNPFTSVCRCRGIELSGMKDSNLRKNLRAESDPIISHYAFEPYFYGDTNTELTDEEYSPLLRCISIVVDNMSFVHDKMSLRKPKILEVYTQVVENETMDINNAIKLHFSVSEINYTYCADDISDAMERVLSKANIGTRTISSISDTNNTEWDLIITDSSLWFKNLAESVQPGGFILFKFLKGQEYVQPDNYKIISHKISKYYEVILMRKNIGKKTENVHFVTVQLDDINWVEEARELMIKQEELFLNGKREEELPYLYFISTSIPLSGIMGFINCLRKEPYSSKVRCIFSKSNIPIDFGNLEDSFLKEIFDKDLVFNVYDENGISGCYIHSQVQPNKTKYLATSSFVNIETPGDLGSFRWYQGFEFDKFKHFLPSTHVSVNVHAAALNFKDVMIATGNLNPEYVRKYPNLNESPIGLEFSGVIHEENGSKRVCGFATAQCLATQVLIERKFLIDVPEKWTMEEAATVPVVYSTAYYALVLRGNIQRNSSILIHSGAGGVGIAAIRIALSYNCQIFTTVSSKEKIEFIKENFPEIPESNIGSSRDIKFEQMVKIKTQGRGVDLILNSLNGDKLEASLRCLAPHGQFLEIGRVDMSRNTLIGSDAFLNDAGFQGIFLVGLCDQNSVSENIWIRLKELLHEGLKSGVVKPIPFRVFTRNQIEPAFRFMGQGIHIGKIIIQIRGENEHKTPPQIPSIPRTFFHPGKVYIILGGLGGVGLEFVNWMTLRYARKIIITSRTGSSNLRGYTESCLKIWKERRVMVEIFKFKPGDDVELLFQAGKTMGDTIGGIFNLTMHAEPVVLKELTKDSFQRTIEPKIILTKQLDEYSREHCPKLDYFVVFSSIAAGLGYDGMTSYGFSNSSIERLVEERQKDGLPGTAIQFGPIGDVGAWHEKYNSDYSLSSFRGSGIQSIKSVLKSFDYLLSNVILTSAPVMLCRRTINTNEHGNGSKILEATLIDRLAQILGHSDGSKLNKKCTLAELGMESVMSIEAKNLLENEFGLILSAAGLREHTLEQLNELAQNKQNECTMARTKTPKRVAATTGGIQLNFFKPITIAFGKNDIIYPLNRLASQCGTAPGPKVIICNSMEVPDVFRVFASYIRAPVFCLQYPPDMDGLKNCQVLGSKYYEAVKKLVPEGPYVVGGYSVGVIPAFELSLLLEKSDEVMKLIFMDMTYERFQKLVEQNGGLETDKSELNLKWMTNSLCQVFGYDSSLLEDIMEKEVDKEAQIKKFDELFYRATGNEKLSYYNSRSSKLFTSYKPNCKFNGNVGLIKAAQNLIPFDTMVEDWGLSKVCTKTPDIINVNTTHSHLIAEPAVKKVAEYFNRAIGK